MCNSKADLGAGYIINSFIQYSFDGSVGVVGAAAFVAGIFSFMLQRHSSYLSAFLLIFVGRHNFSSILQPFVVFAPVLSCS